MSKLIVIGGGAAGMMAASLAAGRGIEVVLVEKNEKLGKKVYITGKGRCNLTNNCEATDFFKNVISNPKFLYSSVYGFTPADTMEYFEALGLRLKTERGNRVFPQSDHSSDVNKYLEKDLRAKGVGILLGTKVESLLIEDYVCRGVKLSDGTCLTGDYVFVATGGLSYPSTGSDGDGYRFAEGCGHKVTRLLPSLVSVRIAEHYVKDMEGLALKNVMLSAINGKKTVFSEMGELVFTGEGISGPLVLTLSSLIADMVSKGSELRLEIDLKPALDEAQLDARILRDFDENRNKNFGNVLPKLLPASMVPVMAGLCNIATDRQINSISKAERTTLVNMVKKFPLTVTRLGGYDEAVVTKGGVDVRGINPATMESKQISGLHFIGEVLDVDALTGGYNLQIAWSTAHAAAMSLEV